jgi:mRNA interferase YafQ
LSKPASSNATTSARPRANTGNWKDHWDCHIKPDLVLIYQTPDENTLQLVRLGSHVALGL